MRLSRLACCLDPSPPRQIFDLACRIPDVIDFTLGDPDIPPPLNIREAGCRAIMAGKTRYSANAGLLELRKAIAADHLRIRGISADPESEIIVCVGAMEASYLALTCLLDAGDEVIIPAPYWINYGQVVKSCQAVPVLLNTRPEDAFHLKAEDLEKAITPRTRLVVLNTPANPTGAVLSEAELQKISEIIFRHDLLVLSDEIYGGLIYDGKKHCSIASLPGMRERTIIIDGFSKKYAMTGWRLGYAIAPKPLIAAMTMFQEDVVACAPLPSQYAGIEALSPDTDQSAICREFQHRRDIVIEELKGSPAIRCPELPATFYAFLDIRAVHCPAKDFVIKLLTEEHVAMIHGPAYGGEAFEGFVRIAFTLQEEKLRLGLRKFRRFAEKCLADGI